MVPLPPSSWARRALRGVAPASVIATAAGYVAVATWDPDLSASIPGSIPPAFHAAIVGLQALILLQRQRTPFVAFGLVVTADLLILGTTAGELGIGALAIIIASYGVARRGSRRPALTALSAGALLTASVGAVTVELGTPDAIAVVVLTAVTRVALLYAAPAVVAEQMRGRERLRESLVEQERMADEARRDQADREVRAERSALARELHDIAGHHLSGIIVGAQAAAALLVRDPDRARVMLRTVQDDARITLTDLRRTVGLLRDDDHPSDTAKPSTAPTIENLPVLVDTARGRGQHVDLQTTGTDRPLGPLAETAAYRMVQESLSNAARHAPGAPVTVTVDWTWESVVLTVTNEHLGTTRSVGARDGHGLSGMAERAELIGATLTVGPTPAGTWSNCLAIPAVAEAAP